MKRSPTAVLALGALALQLGLIAALDGVLPTGAIIAIAVLGGLATSAIAHSLAARRAAHAHHFAR